MIRRFLILMFYGLSMGQGQTADLPKVYLTQIVDHPALEQTKKGIKAALQERGYKSPITLIYKELCAQGSPAMAEQIMTHFISDTPNMIVALGTISAQAGIKYGKKMTSKLVFSSITDPKAAGLLQASMVGITNFMPFKPQLRLIQRIMPKMAVMGVVYNPGEMNSEVSLKEMEKECSLAGIKIVKCPLMKASEASQAVYGALQQGANVLVINNDSTALGALAVVVKVATKHKIPVFVSDVDSVAVGALGALGPDQFDLGLQTGHMIADLIEGKKVEPLLKPRQFSVALNKTMAKTLGIQLLDTKQLIKGLGD